MTTNVTYIYIYIYIYIVVLCQQSKCKYDHVLNGIGVSEDCIAVIQLSFDVHTICCGDFNARTECVPYEVIIPSQSFEVHFYNSTYYFIRNSQDTNDNVFGKMLLNLCSTFGPCLLNGAFKGDVPSWLLLHIYC